MKEPNWPTTILPSTLAIIGNSSCCSRMPGDMAVRNSTASISVRALRSAFSMMSSVIGSTSTQLKGFWLVWMIFAGIDVFPLLVASVDRPDQQAADPVDLGVMVGQDEGGGV